MERSNLRLIEIHRDTHFQKLALVKTFEGAVMWQPRATGGLSSLHISQLKYGIQFGWELLPRAIEANVFVRHFLVEVWCGWSTRRIVTKTCYLKIYDFLLWW